MNWPRGAQVSVPFKAEPCNAGISRVAKRETIIDMFDILGGEDELEAPIEKVREILGETG